MMNYPVLAEGMGYMNQVAFRMRALHTKIGFLNDDMHCRSSYEWFLRVLSATKAVHVDRKWEIFLANQEKKNAKFQASFDKGFLLIRKGPKSTICIEDFYQLRHFFLLFLQGDWPDAFRGVSQRMSGI